jgi:hypothetical protein
MTRIGTLFRVGGGLVSPLNSGGHEARRYAEQTPFGFGTQPVQNLNKMAKMGRRKDDTIEYIREWAIDPIKDWARFFVNYL